MPGLVKRGRVKGESLPGLFSSVFISGLLIVTVGASLESMRLMAAGTLACAVGYGLRDYFSARADSITPMTLTALVFGTWLGLAHVGALASDGTAYAPFFYAQATTGFLLEAQMLATLMVVVPLLTYPLFDRAFRARPPLLPRLPSVGFQTSHAGALWFFMSLLALNWATRYAVLSVESLGTLGFFVKQGSAIFVFAVVWDRLGPSPRFPRWSFWLAAFTILADVSRALMFAYMRGEVAFPVFMFFLAVLIRKAFRPRYVVAGVLFLLALGTVYKSLEEIRQTPVAGVERFPLIIESATVESVIDGWVLLMARACQFDQLSNIVRIVNEDGQYGGATLGYLTYAFIPRLVWPEKPLITPGQWYAERLGRGRRRGDEFSSAVNMTLAGEFYLNFGWMGAVIGLTILSFAYALFWHSIRFAESEANPLAQTLGFAILMQAVGAGFAAAIFQLIFLYLAIFGVTWVVVMSTRPDRRVAMRRRVPGPRVQGCRVIRPAATDHRAAGSDS